MVVRAASSHCLPASVPWGMLIHSPWLNAAGPSQGRLPVIGFVLQLVVTGISLYVADYLLSGVRLSSLQSLVIGALVLGFINGVVRPVMQILSLPITVLTLGLFYFVVNGVSFWLAAAVVPGFDVDGLWSSILGAIVVGLVSWVVGGFTKGVAAK